MRLVVKIPLQHHLDCKNTESEAPIIHFNSANVIKVIFILVRTYFLYFCDF